MNEVPAVSAGQVIIDPDRTALLIIDMQNDFVLPQAELSTPGAMDLIPTIASFAAACRDRGFPVIYTREMHRRGLEDFGVEGSFEPPHCLEGTDGPDIVAGLEPHGDDFVVSAKRRYDAFMGTELDLLLRGLRVENIIFAGVCTDICILSTVVTARNLDYRCYVLRDAVDATCPQRQEAALMCMSHMFARVGDTAEAATYFNIGSNASRPEVDFVGSADSAESAGASLWRARSLDPQFGVLHPGPSDLVRPPRIDHAEHSGVRLVGGPEDHLHVEAPVAIGGRVVQDLAHPPHAGLTVDDQQRRAPAHRRRWAGAK